MNSSVLSGPAPLQILIVEDEPKLGQLLVDYLEAAGYATQWLSNGNDVVPLVKAHPPAMILLDLMLPGSSGLSICRDIRQFSDIPIMMVTAKPKRSTACWGWKSARMTISASLIAHAKWSPESK